MNMNNSDSPLISICIPVYNGETYIEQCMEGILGQTYSNLEILVINDGSTDCTSTLLELYLTDARVKIYNQDNKGVSAARNCGIRCSNGEYIYFCDVDDRISKDAIQIFYENATKYHADFVGANTKWMKPDCRLIKTKNKFDKNHYVHDSVKELLLAYCGDVKSHRNMWTCWNKLYKSSVMKKHGISFDESTFAEEDMIFVIDFLSHCNNVLFIQDLLYEYNHRKNSGLSARGIEEPFAYQKVVNAFKKACDSYRGGTYVLESCYCEMAIWSLYKQVCIYLECNNKQKNTVFNNIKSIIMDQTLQNNIKYYFQKHDDNDPRIPKMISEKNVNEVIQCFIDRINVNNS